MRTWERCERRKIACFIHCCTLSQITTALADADDACFTSFLWHLAVPHFDVLTPKRPCILMRLLLDMQYIISCLSHSLSACFGGSDDQLGTPFWWDILLWHACCEGVRERNSITVSLVKRLMDEGLAGVPTGSDERTIDGLGWRMIWFDGAW